MLPWEGDDRIWNQVDMCEAQGLPFLHHSMNFAEGALYEDDTTCCNGWIWIWIWIGFDDHGNDILSGNFILEAPAAKLQVLLQ
jgi:hypothetical protein